MKVGSIVECVDGNPHRSQFGSLLFYNFNYTFPNRGHVYVVRGFADDGHGTNNILLEEIINPPAIGYSQPLGRTINIEMGFGKNRFRELLPPQDEEIEALLSESFSLELQNV